MTNILSYVHESQVFNSLKITFCKGERRKIKITSEHPRNFRKKQRLDICNCPSLLTLRLLPCLTEEWGFPGGAVIKNLPANAEATGDVGSVPGLGRSSGEGNGNPLQYSCLRSSTDRGAWQATLHGVTKSWTRLSTHPLWELKLQRRQKNSRGRLKTGRVRARGQSQVDAQSGQEDL